MFVRDCSLAIPETFCLNGFEGQYGSQRVIIYRWTCVSVKTKIELHINAVWSEFSESSFVEMYKWIHTGKVTITKHCLPITKTCLYNFDPLKPHFYIVKLGFTEYTLFFLFLLKHIDCGYSLEPPRRGGSNEYPQSVLSRNMKNIWVLLSENVVFGDEIFYIFE